jgi:hypothetical protein
VGVVVLLVLTATAWVGTSTGPERGVERRQDDPSAAPSRPANQVTTTTAATPTTAAKASADGPRNLLANASFEAGAQGWRPIGGARLSRSPETSPEATAGSWSLRLMADPSADGLVGIAVPDATVTKRNGRYHTNAWVRPSTPGTTVTIGLREYRNGQPVPGSNTLGWTVERTGWRQFGAIHVASSPGSRLALEIMARDLPPGGYLDVDEVVLHLLQNR